MNSNLGIMQGRLLPKINQRIQAFPGGEWPKEFELANSLGIKHIEWTFDYEKLFKNPMLDYKLINYIDYLIKKHDLNITTATCDNLMQAPIHKNGPNGATSIENLIKFVENLRQTPIKLIIWPLVDDGSIINKSELRLFLKTMKTVIPVIEESNLRVAFETDFTPEKNNTFISNFPPKFFGLNLDFGNSACYGNSISMEYELNFSHIFNIHIKDRVRNGPTVPLGEGDVNWMEVTEVLKYYYGLKILQCARISGLTEVNTIKKYINFLQTNKILV
jgi:L-ribulose-5-phosphate 3-epimerase